MVEPGTDKRVLKRIFHAKNTPNIRHVQGAGLFPSTPIYLFLIIAQLPQILNNRGLFSQVITVDDFFIIIFNLFFSYFVMFYYFRL